MPFSPSNPPVTDIRCEEGVCSAHVEFEADVTVIIVNYKTPHVLQRGLESIFASRQQVRYEVIVIDNASGDHSAEMVRQKFPQVRCIANQENLGHTGGCNQGMKLAKGRFLFLLNSDTILPDSTLNILVRYLDLHLNVGAVAPRVMNVDGSVQGTVKRFPSPWAALFGRFSILTRLFPQNPWSQHYLLYSSQHSDEPFPVDTASGAALMVRREAITRAGMLDPQFFLYWNDVDWCRSIWQSGLEIHCVPASQLLHEEHHGGSRNGLRQRWKTVVNFHYGAYLYYRKWHIPHRWHPLNGIAIIGLTARDGLVMFAEQLQGVWHTVASSRNDKI